ncbi:hypothetical protein AAFA46_02365 [Oscillospiraceae bacterium WX1]
MSELEDKINKILTSPEDMEKIMGMARSLSGSLGSGSSPGGTSSDAASMPDLTKIASTLGGLDPKMTRLMTRLIGEYSTGSNDKAVLLNAIKPYLKEERHAKIDKATEIAKLAKLAKIALAEFSGGGGGV